MLHTFLSVFIVFLIVYGIEGFGVSPDEIFARVNDSFKITCSVSRAKGLLNFYDENGPVPDHFIKRINDTFIEMTQAYPRPVKKNFTCKQDSNNVGLSEVIVDERMAPVTNFKCRTSNLTSVQCSFKKPAAFLPIKYRFFIAVNGETKTELRLRQDGQSGYNSNFKVSQAGKNSENTSILITVEANNSFYHLKQEFNYRLLEILTPSAVKDLKVMEDLTTHSSVFVTFVIPKVLENSTQAMIFDTRLILMSGKSSTWRKIENPRLQFKGREGYLVLDNLDYANTDYTMKLRMKSKLAEDVDEMWSPYNEVSFTTSPKLPETLPKTCDNCFNVMDNGNVVIYWMEVPICYQNANNFSYLLRGWNKNEEEIINEMLTQTSMLLQHKLISSGLRIELFSVNSVGVSEKFSQIFIHPEHLQVKRKFMKIRKEIINSNYKISWKLLEQLNTESFTIVWCKQRNELPNQCDGSIQFTQYPANRTEFYLPADASYQFGIGVNLKNKLMEKGIEWAECTAAKANEIGQVHSLWSSVHTENAITLYWKLNCADEPIVVGYNITYCSMDEKSMSRCMEDAQSEIVILNDNDELNQYEILNLKSYRLYNVSIALMSKNRLGIPKPTLMIRTLEGAPTAPRNLQTVHIKSHSIDLTWSRPIEVNGESMTYQLWYNDHRTNINDNNTMNETFAYTLENLESFTNYTITVVACTSDCSYSSESLTVRTAIGKPSELLQPKLNNPADGEIILSWDTPLIVGGNLDYFQLKMIHSKDYERADVKVFRISGKASSCFIKGFICEKTNVLFVLRGVNVEHEETSLLQEIESNQTVNCLEIYEPIEGEVTGHFYGEWSQPIIHFCRARISMVMIASVIVMAISMMTSVYLFFRLYQRYKEMKDIHIVWPKGLDPNDLSPQALNRDLYEAVRDLDLVKGHVLSDIEEEETSEREKFIQVDQPEAIAMNKCQRENSKSDSLPFIVNVNTNELFYQVPKLTSVEKSKSAPTSPERNPNDYIKNFNDSHVDERTGYTKMYVPQKSGIESSSVDGYLDMTGKNPSPVKTPTIANGYTNNEVKLFIRDSQKNNNGYIGKRTSVLIDPQLKCVSNINNGYIGIQPK